MNLRVRSKPEGIPFANVTAAPGVTAQGAPQVTAHLAALDAYGIPDIVAHLALSTAEARELALRLTDAADKADAMANPPAQRCRAPLDPENLDRGLCQRPTGHPPGEHSLDPS